MNHLCHKKEYFHFKCIQNSKQNHLPSRKGLHFHLVIEDIVHRRLNKPLSNRLNYASADKRGDGGGVRVYK